MAPNIITKCVCLIILISFTFGLEFVDEELTRETLEGNDLVLVCRYRDVQEGLVVVHWTVPGVQGRTLQSTSNNVDERFSISDEIQGARGDSSLVSGISTLTVTGVNAASDDGVYRCELLDENNRVLGFTETIVTIIQFDPVTNSACWMEPSSTVLLGELREIRCASKDPNAQLTWMLLNTDLGGTQTSSGDTVFLSQRLTVTLRRDAFSCINRRTNSVLCMTSPTVLHAPIVTIVPDGDIYYGATASYNCTGDGMPSDDYTYMWWYDDFLIRENTHHRFNRVQLRNNNRTLVLPDLSVNDDHGVGITCKVTNAIGTGTETIFVEGLIPKSTGEIIGPFLVALMCIIIFGVLLAFFLWWKKQKRMVRRISRRRKKAKNTQRDTDGLPAMTDYTGASGSFVPVSVMDLEAIGYGPDSNPSTTKVESNDRDSGVGDDGIRPIPSRGSTSSSTIGNTNFGYEDDTQSQRDMSFHSSTNAPVDAEETKLKSYSYEVNPNFNSNRKSRTFDIVQIPNSSSEVDSSDEDSDLDLKKSKNIDDQSVKSCTSDDQSVKSYTSDAQSVKSNKSDIDKEESTSGYVDSTSL